MLGQGAAKLVQGAARLVQGAHRSKRYDVPPDRLIVADTPDGEKTNLYQYALGMEPADWVWPSSWASP